MKNNSEILKDIDDIKNEIIELNNMLDKKCFDIYNQNNNDENKIIIYKNYLETIILEYHKVCKIIFNTKKSC